MSTPLIPEEELQKAEQAGRYMVAIWRVEEGKLQLYRMTENFPVVDFFWETCIAGARHS